MESSKWVEVFTLQVGEAIDKARGGRSDQWISDRTKEMRHPISRTAVSEYRRGVRKSMPVTDLMVIAAALEVPPITLLFPRLPSGWIAVLPGVSLPAISALQWFTGEVGKLPKETKVDLTTEESPEFRLLKLSRQLSAELRKTRKFIGQLTRYAELHGQHDLDELQKLFDPEMTLDRVEELVKEIDKIGGDTSYIELGSADG